MKKTSKQSLALYLTVRQTANKLKVTRQDIQEAVRRGRLLAMQAGSAFLIERSTVEAYAKTRAARAPKRSLLRLAWKVRACRRRTNLVALKIFVSPAKHRSIMT